MTNEIIEQELEKLVIALRDEVPSLLTIRVFGSYENGGWDPEKSDIDVFALVNDENYSMYKAGKELPFYRMEESEQRKDLRKKVYRGLREDFVQKLSLSICTPNNMKSVDGCDEGRGDIGKNMRRGRLLYEKEKKRFWEFWK